MPEGVNIWIVVLSVLAVGWPTWRILGRMGLSRWWTIGVVIAPIGLVALWWVAYVEWPAE